MKKSEKLFLAINEIDDKIVDEAKGEEQKPVRVQLEKRMPIKEIIAFAACFAVLAVAIFALVKFKLGSDIEPIDSDSSDSGFDSSDQSFVSKPDIDLTFTEQDRELQAILKDLTAKAEEIDRMFYHMSIIDGESDLKTHRGNYYIIPEGLRTEPDGLFAVPQSVGEMENLIRGYFSSQSAEYYLVSDNVCKGKITENSDGTLIFDPDDIYAHTVSNPTFIEVDGEMYRADLEWDYPYSTLGIDCDTAKVTRSSDKVIEFSYWGYDRASMYESGDVYAERNGAIVYEDGAWKLHYYYRQGFIPEMPNEYTEQDLELHAILEALEPGIDIQALFSVNSANANGTLYNFILPGDYEPEGSYLQYIDVSGPQSSVKHPKSLNELENMLLEYFTQESTDEYMNTTCKGTMTENADGTYTVTLDKDIFFPVYIEIDGKMFYRICAGSGGGYLYDTAKVVERTEDTIIYTLVGAFAGGYKTGTKVLKFERGGWKHDPFYQPPDPEADNKELQTILEDLSAKAIDIDGIFTRLNDYGDKYPLKVNDVDYSGVYYPITENRKTEPLGLFTVPQTRSELEQLLLTYFTSRAVKYYMDDIGMGRMIIDTDGTHALNQDDNMPGQKTFLEVDGQLYRMSWDVYDRLDIDFTTAKVIYKTDKTIRFSYAGYNDAYVKNNGVIVLENGGWKLDFFHGEFIPAMPTEFTDKDMELQAILNELSPGQTICSWFHNGVYTSEGYDFLFPGADYPVHYYLLPQEEPYPQSCNEMEQLLLKYFTQKKADIFMNGVSKGTMTKISDNTYSVETEDENYNHFIEIDGKMYVKVLEMGGISSGIWNTAQVIEKTDSFIKFKYVEYGMGEYAEAGGLIKFERGGWRLNMNNYGGFDFEV